jgi:hypothetical protein
LVYQADGASDICGRELATRAYLGAEDIVTPTITKPVVAILGGYDQTAAIAAGCLDRLGLNLHGATENGGNQAACAVDEVGTENQPQSSELFEPDCILRDALE